eukprot:scaffold10399_cov46-Phaeocystis_antarctica.AAC.1
MVVDLLLDLLLLLLLLVLVVAAAEVLDDDSPAHFLEPALDGQGRLVDFDAPRGLRHARELDVRVPDAKHLLHDVLEMEQLAGQEHRGLLRVDTADVQAVEHDNADLGPDVLLGHGQVALHELGRVWAGRLDLLHDHVGHLRRQELAQVLLGVLVIPRRVGRQALGDLGRLEVSGFPRVDLKLQHEGLARLARGGVRGH